MMSFVILQIHINNRVIIIWVRIFHCIKFQITFWHFFVICDRCVKYLMKILECHSFWILNWPPKLFWLHCDILQLQCQGPYFFSFHQLCPFVGLLCHSSQKYTDLPVSKMSSLSASLRQPTQCQIGLLFSPLHYFHSFRDGLGVKKSNFFFTNKSVQFLR